MGVVPPTSKFLPELRELTRRNGALLIFDEVISGFRLAYGGAQTVFGIEPDITTLGKIIGGGVPAAPDGGRPGIQPPVGPLMAGYPPGTPPPEPPPKPAGESNHALLAAPALVP